MLKGAGAGLPPMGCVAWDGGTPAGCGTALAGAWLGGTEVNADPG